MLNPFPSLLTFTFFAPTILRIAAAVLFLSCARFHWQKRSELRALIAPLISHSFALFAVTLYILIEAAVGGLLFIGLYTQIATIAGMVLALKYAVARPRLLTPYNHATDWLLFAICLSLLVTGAGAFAFDVPL